MNLIKMLPLNRSRLDVLLEIYSEREDYLRNISKKIKMNPSLLHRILNKLHSSGIIEKKQVGKEIQYYLNKNKDYDLVKRILEEYKLEKAIERSQILKSALNLIINNKEMFESNYKIFLFGSYANGSFSKESDIDILFVSENEKPVIKTCREISSIIGKTINPMIYSKENFKKELLKKEALLSSIVKVIKNRAVIK